MVLPVSISKYFWDINPKKANPQKHPQYYIDRLLEIGNNKSIAWLKKTFGSNKIKHSLPTAKISKKSRNYWRLVFS